MTRLPSLYLHVQEALMLIGMRNIIPPLEIPDGLSMVSNSVLNIALQRADLHQSTAKTDSSKSKLGIYCPIIPLFGTTLSNSTDSCHKLFCAPNLLCSFPTSHPRNPKSFPTSDFYCLISNL
jgi:hypothetical protein